MAYVAPCATSDIDLPPDVGRDGATVDELLVGEGESELDKDREMEGNHSVERQGKRERKRGVRGIQCKVWKMSRAFHLTSRLI